MGRLERLRAAIARQPVDRVPYAFWRHFPTVDRSPAGLAQATLRFHDHYGSDFLKITPRAGYAVEAWGCVESEELLPGGHRPFAIHGVRHAEDWKAIRSLDPAAAEGYGEQLETIIRLGFDRRIGDAPVLVTVFSPLSIAHKLAGDRLAADLRDHPDLVAGALEAIADTQVRLAELALAEGVSGVFYAIQAASRRLHADEIYARFGEPHDRRVLGAIHARSTLTIVHAHGEALMFDRLATLPAHAWSWEDRRTPPALADGRRAVPGAVVGGLDPWTTLRDGTPEAAAAEAQDAVACTDGLGVVVAPGCVLAMNTPDATLAAVVKALGGPLKPVPGVRA
jgi:uroporphyrinogen decarboxylase